MMRGTCAQAKVYCTKLETRVQGEDAWAWEKGEMPTQGARRDITELITYSKTHTELECWNEFPSLMARQYGAIRRYREVSAGTQRIRPKVMVLWGPTGTGKSYKAMMLASGGENGVFGDRDFFSMLTPSSVGSTPWVDGYDGQEWCVIEDFSGEINYRILLRMLDQYPNKMQVKGGMVEFKPVNIIISSNKHPSEWYPTESYIGGPLERRLEKDGTGMVREMTKVWEAPKL